MNFQSVKSKIAALFALFILLGFVSCQKEVEENGLTNKINKIISEAVLSDIENMGMPIYRGGNPPADIEGEYLISPDICKASNRPNDQYGAGHQFSDYYVSFEKQNNRKLTVDVNLRQAFSEGEGADAYLVGNGDNFTVFVKIKGKILSFHNYQTVDIYSGTITSNGIKNLYQASIMIKGGGELYGLIENNQCRIAFDSDGFSERTANTKSIKSDDTEEATTIVSIKQSNNKLK
jgi:hypothetical protein